MEGTKGIVRKFIEDYDVALIELSNAVMMFLQMHGNGCVFGCAAAPDLMISLNIRTSQIFTYTDILMIDEVHRLK
ncbi:MAG: hypothetical protein EPN24_01430 [Candidatus Methanoperedens sp.]|nr:MAG: hypothetical protein EPN24_01430 [Candidatus Methanoperedens sp.]